MDSLIEPRILKFQRDLHTMDAPDIVRKHVILGSCYVLDSDQHYDLRRVIAEKYEINPTDIHVVGSAKLGFSIVKGKRYRAFCDKSDIDVAIVSGYLFDQFWQHVFEYWDNVGAGDYWNKENSFKEYLFRGWIRPDMLPSGPNFPKSHEWFDFFRQLTQTHKYGQVKIAAGLYKSLYFLEKYHIICTRECQLQEGRLV